jgi:predicted flavoprotein YhiN
MHNPPRQFDVVVLGAGAAGLMCAAVARRRGRRVAVLEHNAQPGRKILISGGGRCNFTNLHCAPDRFLSENPHFAKSALALYQPRHFIELVDRYAIRWHEKTLGQLFLRSLVAADCRYAAGGMRCRSWGIGTGRAGAERASRGGRA